MRGEDLKLAPATREMKVLSLISVLAAGCAGYVLPARAVPARAGTGAGARMALVPDDASEACILLPHPPFPGTPHPLVGGEMCLQELEDDTDTRTQIFLNADGTLTHGATDGPPPLDMCGLWQCGDEGFQMTVQRTFSNSPSVLPPGSEGQMKDDLAYTVTRTYIGSVDDASDGVKIVEGKMDFFSEAGADEDTQIVDNAQPWKGEVLQHAAAPIGYFVLDGNVEAADEKVEA